MGKGNGETVGERYHCFVEGLSNSTSRRHQTDLWKGYSIYIGTVSSTRYIVGGQKYAPKNIILLSITEDFRA